MKKEMESLIVNKTDRKHDALLAKKGKKLFSAISTLPLRGGKIDLYWLSRYADAKQNSIEKNSQPRRRYNQRHGLNSSRGILMAYFSDKRSSDLAVWRFNGKRHIFWPHISINFSFPNCRVLLVASTALPRCWSRQFILLCSKSLTRQRSQQHLS